MKQLEFDFVSEMYGDESNCAVIESKDVWRLLLDNPMYNLYMKGRDQGVFHMLYRMDQMSFSKCLADGNDIYVLQASDRLVPVDSLKDERIKYVVLKKH